MLEEVHALVESHTTPLVLCSHNILSVDDKDLFGRETVLAVAQLRELVLLLKHLLWRLCWADESALVPLTARAPAILRLISFCKELFNQVDLVS